MRVLSATAVAFGVIAVAHGYPLRGGAGSLDSVMNRVTSPVLLSVTEQIRAGSPAEKILELLDTIINNLERAQVADADAFSRTNSECEKEAGSYRTEFTDSKSDLQKARQGIEVAQQTIDAKDAQITALNDEIADAEAAIEKAEGAMKKEKSMYEDSLKTYRRNQNQITEAKNVVQAILSHLKGEAPQKETTEAAFLQLSSHLTKLGMHDDAANAANALEPSVEQRAAALEKEMTEKANGMLSAAAEEQEAAELEAMVGAGATGATGSVEALPEAVVGQHDAQRIIDLVVHLLNRLDAAEKRDEAQQNEATRKYKEFAAKLQADIDEATARKVEALGHKKKAATSRAHALAAIKKHRDTVTDEKADVSDAEAALSKAESVCGAYRAEFEARTNDRRADIESAKTIRTLVKEKLHNIMAKLEDVMAATGSASADF